MKAEVRRMLEEKFEAIYQKYANQTLEENGDRDIDYHEEIGAIIEDLICNKLLPFKEVAELLANLKEV